MEARDWDQRYLRSELIWGEPPNAVVAQHVSQLPPGRALDLACGAGRNALWLAGLGWDVTAVDWSQVAIDKARTVAAKLRRPVRDRVEWLRTDVTQTQFSGGYSLVLLSYLHLPARERRIVLEHAVDALHSAGVLLVLGHDSTNTVGGPPDRDILFTPDDVVSDLDGRLLIQTAETLTRVTEEGDALDALVIATKPPSPSVV